MGGAYGAMCSLDVGSGMLILSSYRDPGIRATLEAYDGAAESLRRMAERFESGRPEGQRELAAAVVGAIGDRDAPSSAVARGGMSLTRHIAGVTNEMRQAMRDEVLATGPQHFRELADRVEQVATHGAVAVVGGEEELRAFGATAGGDTMEVTRILPYS